MSDAIPFVVQRPARIRSWKDLLVAAEELIDDADNHGYRAFRSSGRKYCANVKVHSYGRVETAIANLGDISPEAQEILEEDFGDEVANSIFYEWLESSAEYVSEWFKGVAHDSPDYLEKVIDKIKAGQSTGYPFLDEELTTKRKRIAAVREWQRENALFLEAFAAADHGASIVWEGRSGGYVTWDPDTDIERGAREVADHAYDAVNGLKESCAGFCDTLREFRQLERCHLLNLALIDYLEAWAKRMSFQDELDYVIQQRYDELGGDVKAKGWDEQYGDTVVTFDDSIAAGNCSSGTMNWIARNIPGRTSATVRELLKIEDMKHTVRRLCRFVIRKHATS